MTTIGIHSLSVPLILAPMAGVTDIAFRRVARKMGASLTIGEMVASEEQLRRTSKTQERFRIDAKDPIPAVQLLGSDPAAMANAARYACAQGAKLVDINFGCPARLVCGKACGSALMADEERAKEILAAVREAVDVAVTVKMRLGWDAKHKNVLTLAREAEKIGINAVTVHGRTCAARFTGSVDYEATGEVVRSLSIPVIANGDIDSAAKALSVLNETKASALMVARATLGAPWVLKEMREALLGRTYKVTDEEKVEVIRLHMREHFDYWGENVDALRRFRKHVVWYVEKLKGKKSGVEKLLTTDNVEAFQTDFLKYVNG